MIVVLSGKTYEFQILLPDEHRFAWQFASRYQRYVSDAAADFGTLCAR